MKTTSKLLMLAILVLAAGCLAPQRSTAPALSRERCDPLSIYCDGNTVKQCSEEGVVELAAPCGETAVCIQGACVRNQVCTPGEAMCVQGELQRCDDSGWALQREPCGDQLCVDGACVEVGEATCLASTSYCVGNIAYQCNSSGTGLLSDPAPCGGDLCVNGACHPVVCEPGTASCDGHTATTCNSIGTGFSEVLSCDAPFVCIRGRCQEILCEPGARCEGDDVVVCNAEGTAELSRHSCAPGSCAFGACYAVEEEEGCTTDSACRQSEDELYTCDLETGSCTCDPIGVAYHCYTTVGEAFNPTTCKCLDTDQLDPDGGEPCDGECAQGYYTECTCAPADPCGWAGDGVCDLRMGEEELRCAQFDPRLDDREDCGSI